jgi:hypothetical protein
VVGAALLQKSFLKNRKAFSLTEVVQLEWEQIFIDARPLGREITKGKGE